MNLHMMRDINAGDALPGLGPRVTPAPTPAPQPVRRPDGIVVGPDGKLSTDFPPPPPEPSWPFQTGTAAPAPEPIPEPEPGAHGFMREPLKVGQRVRLLVDAPLFEYMAGQMFTVSKVGDSGLFWTDDDPLGLPLSTPEEEGKLWERIHEPAAMQWLRAGVPIHRMRPAGRDGKRAAANDLDD